MSKPCLRARPARDEPEKCLFCGHLIETGVDGGRPYVRHLGERRRRMHPSPEDAATFARSIELVEAALADLPPGASEDERAAAAVEALMKDGRLRRRRGAQRYVLVEDVEVEPDCRTEARASA